MTKLPEHGDALRIAAFLDSRPGRAEPARAAVLAVVVLTENVSTRLVCLAILADSRPQGARTLIPLLDVLP